MNNWDKNRVLAVYSPAHQYNGDLIITSLPDVKRLFSATISHDSVSVMKYATGKGDIDGGVKIELCNNLNFPVRVVLLDSAPWHAEMLFSSLLITESAEGSESQTAVIPGNLIYNLRLISSLRTTCYLYARSLWNNNIYSFWSFLWYFVLKP